uniref:Uncharacterized protein LOC100183792 n=1 Tax=Phallusia mammillata TaxID=59560 RepID=A0A6F9DIN9_9ASCI|nr:uncharacterized protein LOC100183792 [Phallusia mammillata]
MSRSCINNLRRTAILLFGLFFLKVTAADHNSAVKNHFTNPCSHLGDELARYLAEDDDGISCCLCPENFYYHSACKNREFNTTVCLPCPEGTERKFSTEVQGLEMCKPIPTIKPKSTTPQPTKKIISTDEQDGKGETGESKQPENSVPGLIIGLLVAVVGILVMVGLVVWCVTQKPNIVCCFEVKKTIPDVEAGVDMSSSSVTTGHSSQTPVSNRRDSIASTTSAPQANPTRKYEVQYTQCPTNDPDVVITEKGVTNDGQATPEKVKAIPLRTDYRESRTISENPTAPRVQQPVCNTDDRLGTPPETSTGLPVIRGYNINRNANIQTILNVFFSIGTTLDVPITAFQVEGFGYRFGLVDDQICTAKKNSVTEGNAAFLCKVFKQIVSKKGIHLDLNEVVNFFEDNGMRLIYDHLVQQLG